jgi:hypothetical protein
MIGLAAALVFTLYVVRLIAAGELYTVIHSHNNAVLKVMIVGLVIATICSKLSN